MADIYENQELIIRYTDDAGEDWDVQDFRVDYWAPSNRTSTPDGTVPIGNLTTSPGSPIVIIKIDQGVLNEPSDNLKKWRVQPIDNLTGVGWDPYCFPVLRLGHQAC